MSSTTNAKVVIKVDVSAPQLPVAAIRSARVTRNKLLNSTLPIKFLDLCVAIQLGPEMMKS